MIYYHVTTYANILLKITGIPPRTKLTNSIGNAMEEILKNPKLMDKNEHMSIIELDLEKAELHEESPDTFYAINFIDRNKIKRIISLSGRIPDFRWYNTQEESILGDKNEQ
jgi:hypothetical protein